MTIQTASDIKTSSSKARWAYHLTRLNCCSCCCCCKVFAAKLKGVYLIHSVQIGHAIYRTLLHNKLARAPGVHKRYFFIKQGGRNRIEPEIFMMRMEVLISYDVLNLTPSVSPSPPPPPRSAPSSQSPTSPIHPVPDDLDPSLLHSHH